MPSLTRYTLIKRFLIKYPKVREIGASVFLMIPLPFSKFIYQFMRRFVFRDNARRLTTFHQAFKALSQRSKSVNYMEFGVARGTSVISAYGICTHYGMECNAFAFDSFQGLPGDEGGVFAKGDYSYPQKIFRKFVSKAGVPASHIRIIPGFFEQSLTPDLYASLGLKKAAHCIHIDSDLYESAKTVLNWLTPILDTGSVIIFDDWFAFDHMPDPENFGEQKAFREWSDYRNWKQLYVENEWNIAFIRN